MKNLWGILLLVFLGGFYIFSFVQGVFGTGIPPLAKSGKYFRTGSKHTTRYHGYYFGGGIRSGK